MIIYAEEDRDFDWIYKFHGKNSDLLGPCMPAALRESIRHNEVIITDDNLGFCEFHVTKKAGHVTVYHIAVKPESRGKGIAKEFLKFIQETYNRPIKAVCISDSPSEAFWSRVANKIDEKVSRKGTKLSVYFIGEQPAQFKQEELF